MIRQSVFWKDDNNVGDRTRNSRNLRTYPSAMSTLISPFSPEKRGSHMTYYRRRNGRCACIPLPVRHAVCLCQNKALMSKSAAMFCTSILLDLHLHRALPRNVKRLIICNRVPRVRARAREAASCSGKSARHKNISALIPFCFERKLAVQALQLSGLAREIQRKYLKAVKTDANGISL